MPPREWAQLRHDPQLDLHLLHAYYVEHAYPRHTHDYYVIAAIVQGRQSFLHEGRRHFTTPGGVIFITPGEVHTGESAAAGGFELRSLYPTVAQMQAAAADLPGRDHRVDRVGQRDPGAADGPADFAGASCVGARRGKEPRRPEIDSPNLAGAGVQHVTTSYARTPNSGPGTTPAACGTALQGAVNRKNRVVVLFGSWTSIRAPVPDLLVRIVVAPVRAVRPSRP